MTKYSLQDEQMAIEEAENRINNLSKIFSSVYQIPIELQIV